MTKARRTLTRIATGVVVIALVGWLTWLVVSLAAERDFEAKVSELRRQGVRVSLRDFHRVASFDAENGATILRDAMDALPEDALEEPGEALDLEVWGEAGREHWGEDDRRSHAESWRAVEEWVDGLTPWFASVDRAVRLPRCDFGLDTSDWFETSSDSFRLARVIAQTLAWKVRVLERRGVAPNEALRACESLLLWVRKSPPDLLIGQLISMTVEGVAFDLLKRVTTIPGLAVDSARRTLEPLLLNAEHDGPRLRAALDAEFASMIEVARIRASWDGARKLELVLEDETSLWLHLHLLVRRDRLWRGATREIEYWQDARSIIEADDAQAWQELTRFSGAVAREDWLPGELRIMHHALLARVQKRRLVHRAHLRVARLGLAALEHRKLHGSWPEYPEGLAPLFPDGVPVDPFTHKPFEFVTDESALRIEAAVPWLDEYEGESREDERIYWTLK